MTVFEQAVEQMAPHLRHGALVVLRSTVHPGTTAYVRRLLADAGCTVDLAFCPERIAEGHVLEELHTLPQIIGADDDVAADRATALFNVLVPKTVRTTTGEAELAKLFTNFRLRQWLPHYLRWYLLALRRGRRPSDRTSRRG